MGKAVISKIHPVNLSALERMNGTLLLKGYSPNTIKTYSIEFAQLLYLLKDVNIDTLTSERLRSYMLYCVQELKLSENIIHSRMNAIKFYFEQVLHRDKMFFKEIPRIEAGKGKKDRYVTLPTSILEELRNYYRANRPTKYLFEGQNSGQYSVRSVQAVFKDAMEKAKINKSVGIHGLRHSYATHLLESGTDMVFIQKLLGHQDIKTTEIYAKVSNRILSNVKSPLDDL